MSTDFTTRRRERSAPVSLRREPHLSASQGFPRSEPALDIGLLLSLQERMDGIRPDTSGLRWVAEPGEICFYAARDLDAPYDDFVSAVDIVDIKRRLRKGCPRAIWRVEQGANEHRVWAHARHADEVPGGIGEQGYLAFRRRPDGGVRVSMLTRRELPRPSAVPISGVKQWSWVRTRANVSAFRSHFRRTIGLIEGVYVGPDLQLTH